MSISIQSLTQKYQIDKEKPHFPLNSLRLVYLILAETVVADEPAIVEERARTILDIIPKVRDLFDARTQQRAQSGQLSHQSEWEAILPHIQDLAIMVDDPQLTEKFEAIFGYVFPLQDTFLVSMYADLSGENKHQIQDLFRVFQVRSMDSIVYSTLVTAILRRGVDVSRMPEYLGPAIHYRLNALYQLNDLVDSIVYAQEDMGGASFSPFKMIKNSVESIDEAKQLIKNITTTFERKIQTFPLGDVTEKLLRDFTFQLIDVIGRQR